MHAYKNKKNSDMEMSEPSVVFQSCKDNLLSDTSQVY